MTHSAENDAGVWSALDTTRHCFRENNCAHHADHTGPRCCCCWQSPEAHSGCDCE